MAQEMRTELEIWKVLSQRAEERFGKARADEIRADIEQVVGELRQIDAYPLKAGDEA
jgi:hypothetical protein